jgi:hypothetical protein
MKHFCILVFLLVSASFLQGQITLTRSDYYDYDNKYYRGYQNTGLLDIDLSLSNGPNQTWDFSWIDQNISDTLKISKADLTPFYDEFPNADYGLSSSISNYFYEEITPAGARILGKVNYDAFNSTYNVFRYNTPQITFPYPLNYTDTFSFTQQYRVQYAAFFPGSDSIRQFNHSRFEVEADAWGRLILPIGNFEVLRLKQRSFITDTTYSYTNPGGWSSGDIYIDTTDTYLFYAKEIGYRLMSYTQLISGNSRSLGYLVGYDLSIQTPGNTAFKFYPNPSNEQIFLEIEKEGSLQIRDMQGRIIMTESVSKGKNMLSLKELPNGIYFASVLTSENDVSNPQKLIVTHH